MSSTDDTRPLTSITTSRSKSKSFALSTLPFALWTYFRLSLDTFPERFLLHSPPALFYEFAPLPQSLRLIQLYGQGLESFGAFKVMSDPQELALAAYLFRKGWDR